MEGRHEDDAFNLWREEWRCRGEHDAHDVVLVFQHERVPCLFRPSLTLTLNPDLKFERQYSKALEPADQRDMLNGKELVSSSSETVMLPSMLQVKVWILNFTPPPIRFERSQPPNGSII